MPIRTSNDKASRSGSTQKMMQSGLGPRFSLVVLTISHAMLLLATPVSSFTVPTTAVRNTIDCRISSIAISGTASSSSPADPEDEISKQLARAKAVLEASRAKIEARELAVAEEFSSGVQSKARKGALATNVPFFATAVSNGADKNGKKDKVIKNKNEDGLFTTDGDLMAKLSEEEEWEPRPLLEVFTSERERQEKDPLADRDVAASIFNLRKVLQTEDFHKIFDKRNRFIGDP
mmetsp:Transcript_3958/g.6228  ORF Transcript_3958/g.6228 Transcript_3958/m.6228 type:complete len:234 (-) Transcript_3958:841-1542(-)